MEYLLAAGAIFGLNLLPAFGPPTWAVLVLFRLNSDLDAVPLVLVGAIAAASGRFVLASATRRLRPRLSAARRESLAAAEHVLVGSRGRLPRALACSRSHPFLRAAVRGGRADDGAAAAAHARILRGRLVSYSLYVAASAAAKDSLGVILEDSLTSPLGLVLQVAMLAR